MPEGARPWHCPSEPSGWRSPVASRAGSRLTEEGKGRNRMRTSLVLAVVGLVVPALHAQNDWPAYAHDPGGQRFSPLKQINASNVAKLVPAWSYEMKKEGQPFRLSQSIPIMVNGVLYLGYPYNRVVALEP